MLRSVLRYERWLIVVERLVEKDRLLSKIQLLKAHNLLTIESF